MSKVITDDDVDYILGTIKEIKRTMEKIKDDLNQIDDYCAEIVDIMNCAEEQTDDKMS